MRRRSSPIGVGKRVATILAGSWRRQPGTPSLSSPALEEAALRLLETGTAGLGWMRVRSSDLRHHPSALQLQQAYRFQVLQAALYEDALQQLVASFRSAGIDPLFGKGWASARLYAEPGLRPCGDIDLYVPPGHYAAAMRLLGEAPATKYQVDLHPGFPDLNDCDLNRLYERSKLIRLAQTDMRVLAPEDHVRHLCVHFLRHGAWRPLWLCDIAAAVENLPADFDWDYCLSGDRRRTEWTICAIALARQLLEARVEDAPLAVRSKVPPRWLLSAVLKQWSKPYLRFTDSQPILAYWRRPTRWPQALGRRWPNPIEATVSLGGSFNRFPRLPYQLGDCALRCVHLFHR